MSTTQGPETKQAPHAPAGCPVSHRRTDQPGEEGAAIALEGEEWVIRSARLAQQLLRESDRAIQSGFGADSVHAIGEALPILYGHGPEHRKQRARIARFFTPKHVDAKYRDLMQRQVELALAAVTAPKPTPFETITMRYSVAVAREVLGLTNSSVDGLARRLNTFFSTDIAKGNQLQVTAKGLRVLAQAWYFYLRDVHPAVKARRVNPGEDVVSYLIGEGRGRSEILTECITYAAAGMVTTREFITLATWQFLSNDALRQRYLAAEQPERYRILTELLRVDPVVATLRRKLTDEVTLTLDDVNHRLPKDARVRIPVRQTNADESVVGQCPVQVDPDRKIGEGFKADVIAFGDGAHRCPGTFIAIQETDLLLHRLLQLPLELVAEPNVDSNALLESYALRGIKIRLKAPVV